MVRVGLASRKGLSVPALRERRRDGVSPGSHRPRRDGLAGPHVARTPCANCYGLVSHVPWERGLLEEQNIIVLFSVKFIYCRRVCSGSQLVFS